VVEHKAEVGQACCSAQSGPLASAEHRETHTRHLIPDRNNSKFQTIDLLRFIWVFFRIIRNGCGIIQNQVWVNRVRLMCRGGFAGECNSPQRVSRDVGTQFIGCRSELCANDHEKNQLRRGLFGLIVCRLFGFVFFDFNRFYSTNIDLYRFISIYIDLYRFISIYIDLFEIDAPLYNRCCPPAS